MSLKIFLKLTTIYFLSLSVLVSVGAKAQEMSLDGDADGAYLDPQYPRVLKIFNLDHLNFSNVILPPRNDVEAVIRLQTPVKSQGQRGTCSIFSAIGLLESHLVGAFGFSTDINLSEEWLQYVTHLRNASTGSTSYSNFRAFSRYGAATEKTMPYIGEEWETLQSSPLAKARCENVVSSYQSYCLVGHRDPNLIDRDDSELRVLDQEVFEARQSAFTLRNQYLNKLQGGASRMIYAMSEVKSLLNQNIPLNLDVDFYYGAWNHRVATELGLKRNLRNWDRGIVGYPAPNSKDREVSLEKPAGHSITIVGYDDEVEFTVETQMADGSTQNITYQGVYYFKNSWGTDKFGVQFELNGTNYPGYGMITQEYAHQYGAFYHLPLR